MLPAGSINREELRGESVFNFVTVKDKAEEVEGRINGVLASSLARSLVGSDTLAQAPATWGS